MHALVEMVQPWWRRVPLSTALASLVAVATLVAYLWTAWPQMSATPVVTGSVVVRENLLRGDELEAVVDLHNLRADVGAWVRDLRLSLENDDTVGGMKMLSLPVDALLLSGGERIELPAEWEPLPLGEYRLTMSAVVKSGFFRAAQRIRSSRSIRIWDPEPRARVLGLHWEKGVGTLAARVDLGRSARLRCQATLSRAAQVRLVGPSFPGVETWPDPEVSRDGTVKVLVWETPRLEAPREEEFMIHLRFSGEEDDPPELGTDLDADIECADFL
jgi:hypothetical protein